MEECCIGISLNIGSGIWRQSLISWFPLKISKTFKTSLCKSLMQMRSMNHNIFINKKEGNLIVLLLDIIFDPVKMQYCFLKILFAYHRIVPSYYHVSGHCSLKNIYEIENYLITPLFPYDKTILKVYKLASFIYAVFLYSRSFCIWQC